MKFATSILISLSALSISEVAAQRGFGNGFGGGRGGGNGNGNGASSAASSTAVAVASSTGAAAVASSSSSTGSTGSTGNTGSGNTGSGNSGSGNSGSGSSNEAASVTCLQADAVQTGSDQAGALTESGESPSATDPANFINFCAGKTLTNGLQVKGGSCNGIPMGNIPSTDNMISTVITFPTGAQDEQIGANTAFTITLKTSNLQAGVFTNPDTTYYAAPQDLEGGIIIGHTHVTVQDTGGSLPSSPLDPGTFAFFKGINTAVDQNGELTADVTAGLPTGFYRVCTLTSSANHQPVLMPIAQRGAQDDCRYFSVGGANQASSSGSGSTSNSTGAGSAATSSAAGTGATSTTGAGSATSSTGTGSGTSTGGNGGGNGRGGRGGRGGRRGRFMERAYVA